MNRIDTQTANWFHWMGLAGLFSAVVFFLLYGFGFPETDMPIDESMKYWDKSVEEYHQIAGSTRLTNLFQDLPDSNTLSILSLVLLLSATPLTLLGLIVNFFYRKEIIQSLFALGIIAVLTGAVLGFP